MLQAFLDFLTFWKVTGSAVAPVEANANATRSEPMEFHYATEKSMFGLGILND